jgi:glutamate dehydrogenase (NAD(P)+)/glutamate dehydrogenase (NADP+)
MAVQSQSVESSVNSLEKARQQLAQAGELLELPAGLIARLGAPDKLIQTYSPVRMDDGSTRQFSGYRVQHSNILGPYTGGVRFHPNVDLDQVTAHAMLMTWQCSLVGLPYGGARGGVTVDPYQLSESELERLTRRYTSDMILVFDPKKDIPTPDVNTGSREMAWIMDTWSVNHGFAAPGVVTGKPLSVGGTMGRHDATGRGVILALRELLALKGRELAGMTVALQGFGKLGTAAARLAHEAGAKVVAVSDITGGIYHPDGLDLPDVLSYRQAHRFLKGYPKAEPISEEAILYLSTDVLIPAAFGGQIHAQNADRIRAEFIVEGANGPITPEADVLLEQRGVTVLPDILANSGGVIVSYFEWIQDNQQLFWSEEEVNDRLQDVMARAFAKVAQNVRERGLSFRMGAYIEGVGRCAEAHRLRGLYP